VSGSAPTPSKGRAASFLAGSPLGIRPYRLLYIGAVTTSMAYTMQSAMAGWLMASLSGSALLVGLVQAASTLPFLLFGLVSGSVADLVDRRYILVVTHLMMGLATASVGLMSHAGWLQPWSLVVCTLLCGLGYTFYQPAQQASINGLVPRPLLPKAVALGSIAFNAARSVGPAMAGLIAALMGDGLAVLVASLFFLPMLPAAWQALEPRTPVPAGSNETLWSGLVSGLRFARHARVLRAALIINFCFCFCAAALWAMFPLVAQQRLGLAAGGYGFLYSTFGLGAVAAGLCLEQRNPGGLVSLVGVGRIAGEVSSEGVGIPFSARVSSMLSLLGSLNLALFAFNLVPLLPLDGGHVAGACWEGLRRAWARWRGRPDPGPVDTARMLPVGQGVFVALVVMALVLIWVDIVAPF